LGMGVRIGVRSKVKLFYPITFSTPGRSNADNVWTMCCYIAATICTMFKVAIVIPCFNEENSVGRVVRSVHEANRSAAYTLVPVVVNDRSTDQTSRAAAAEDCVLLDLPVNLGIGGAVQTGFRYAFENNFDAAIQLDGDGQHPATQIETVLQPVLQDNADVVIGSRFISKTGFQSSSMRRVGIRFFKHLLKRFVHVSIHDSTSGFRCLNKKALAVVAYNYPDDYPEPVAIILFHKHRLRMLEVQVDMQERQDGSSSIGGLSSFYYMLKVSLAICFTYFRKIR
jgi:glycosyltransferase involved in cell wall biosynthesis